MSNITSEINSQFDNFNKIIDYFSSNFDRLPPLIRLKFLEANLEFLEKIKPIYAVAVALRGDCSMDNEEHDK